MGTSGTDDKLARHIRKSVATALAEDIGDGDLTASLVKAGTKIRATVMTREDMVMAGRPWFEEVMRQVDASIDVNWEIDDGARVDSGNTLCALAGPAASILSAERSALNFLQLLSAVATRTAKYVAAVAGTGCRILDTRKTIPGLRLAQKYAVVCGGDHGDRPGEVFTKSFGTCRHYGR